METQSTFLDALQTFADVADEVDLDGDLTATANGFAVEIREFRVLVPVVGSFNAGKTSLINAWLGCNEGAGLPTDIVPQTALATEIHPVTDEEHERVDLFDEDNKVLQHVDLTAFAAFEKDAVASGQSDVRYAKAMLRAERLSLGCRQTLVDMPGLDSGLRNHNAAILRYLPLGSYFILVADIEHGALRESEVLQLREFLEQDVEFTVLVNKAEKKTSAVRDEIVGHVEAQVRDSFGKAAQVHAVSALDGDVAAFENAVESADFELCLRNYWRRRLFSVFDDAIISLHTRYGAINVSGAEGDRFIQKLQRKRVALEDKLREDHRDIRRMYGDRAVDRIVREVRDEIRESADSLASSFQTGGNTAFDAAMNELVRSTLNRALSSAESETRERIDERYQADIDSLNDELFKFVGNAEELQGRSINVDDFAESVSRAAEQMPAAFRNAKERLSTSRGRGTYQTIVGVAAAATNVVAPWIEVVLIMMPLIVDGMKRWIHGHGVQEQQQQMRIHIANSIAPKIAGKLRGEIRDEYDKLARDLLSGLEEGVKRQVDGIEADIRQSRDEIEKEKTDSEARKAQLRQAVIRLTEARERIERV